MSTEAGTRAVHDRVRMQADQRDDEAEACGWLRAGLSAWKQEAFASVLGVAKSVVSDMAHGRRPLSARVLVRLVRDEPAAAMAICEAISRTAGLPPPAWRSNDTPLDEDTSAAVGRAMRLLRRYLRPEHEATP